MRLFLAGLVAVVFSAGIAVADVSGEWGESTPVIIPTPCLGDHNHDRAVTIDEVLLGIACAERATFQTGECNGYSTPVTISQLIRAVSHALTGCE